MRRRGCRDCPESEERPTREIDLDSELTFHYSRSEREKRRLRPLPEHTGKNPFRGNRSLLILAIDVLIVVLLAGIYFFFLRGDPSVVTIEGYEFELAARRFQGETILSLRVRQEGGEAPPGEPFQLRLLEPSPELVSQRSGAEAGQLSPDTRRLIAGEPVFDLLPSDGPRSLRLLFPAFPEVDMVTVVVGWGEIERELSAPLDLE